MKQRVYLVSDTGAVKTGRWVQTVNRKQEKSLKETGSCWGRGSKIKRRQNDEQTKLVVRLRWWQLSMWKKIKDWPTYTTYTISVSLELNAFRTSVIKQIHLCCGVKVNPFQSLATSCIVVMCYVLNLSVATSGCIPRCFSE